MRPLYLALLFSLICLTAYSQSFEGEVIYHTTCISKVPNVTDSLFNYMAGDTVWYYMKGGDYRSELNGRIVQWELYLNRENKFYDKVPYTDTIFTQDGSINNDPILNVKLIKNAGVILGHNCDELIFNCKDSNTKYWYCADYYINSKLYVKQAYQNWYDYLKRSNAMPLQMVIESKIGIETMTAIAVIKKKVADSIFTLPPNAVFMPFRKQ